MSIFKRERSRQEKQEPFTKVKRNVRIEPGPRRLKAEATKELLDDKVTARHYQEGKRDAVGKKIRLGHQMDFLDWRHKYVWYIYHYEDVMINHLGQETDNPAEMEKVRQKWVLVGEEPTKEDALKVAHSIKG